MRRRIDLELAAAICQVKPGTIRRWVNDGRIHRYHDGYDYDELIAARDSRSLDALMSRAGIKAKDRPARHVASP